MTSPNLVFALEFTYWDAPPESGSTEVIAKPTLEAYSNAALAASSNEGINIVEGDLSFFAANGSPLRAVFFEQPYVDTGQLKYFAGKYSLEAGSGKTLREIISDRSHAGVAIIVRIAASDEAAHMYGWENIEEMKRRSYQALEVAIPHLTGLVDYEAVTVDAA